MFGDVEERFKSSFKLGLSFFWNGISLFFFIGAGEMT